MTCAALGVTGNTVLVLTDRRIEKVDKELQPSWLVRLRTLVIRFAFEAPAIRALQAMAVNFTDDSIWFKGVATESWGDNIDVRSVIKTMVPRLERLKASLLSIRAQMLKLQKSPHSSLALKDASGIVINSLVDLFEAIEGFKWTLMELEANHSPIDEGYTASTPDEVAQLFKRIQQEA